MLRPGWIRIQEVKKYNKRKTIKISCFEELDILSGGLEVGHKNLTNTNLNKYFAIKIENLFNLLMFIINLGMNPEMVRSGS
jgi:hypothetical protein